MMIECAQVIGCDDTSSAAQLLGQVRQFASANGSGEDRVAYYFAKALDACLSGPSSPPRWPAIGSPSCSQHVSLCSDQ
ncbi:hypothetical protein GOP47_0000103 [Adiantum capillus-veneris]|uniref:Uncharacterized protein n=1 Tax=Adiantum capillus-veneris TaxID=13818 RepID=A0A9D4ZQ89_ADICA|nr:hypothetical protein GOP47_0000103 [Adiantum capillus-veneris]